METVFSLMDGAPSLTQDAKPAPDFYTQLERERVKVGTGMVSQRYQRLERRLLGKQVGPDTLNRGALAVPAGSVGIGPSAPDSTSVVAAKPSKPRKEDRWMASEYSRFLPASNDGKPTPWQELQKEGISTVKRRSHAVAHAMGTPQRICLQLTPDVKKKLGEMGITSGGMLRPAPNPIREAVKAGKAQEPSSLRRPSQMPHQNSARHLASGPRPLSPMSPRRVDTGRVRTSASPMPLWTASSSNGPHSARFETSSRTVGKPSVRLSAGAHSARTSSSASGGGAPPSLKRTGSSLHARLDPNDTDPLSVQMQKMIERREAAMRRQVDLFLIQQRRNASSAEWALDQQARSGEDKVIAQVEAAQNAARKRWEEVRRRGEDVNKQIADEAQASRKKAVEELEARAKEQQARALAEKQFRESVVEARQREARERAAQRARRAEMREQAIRKYEEVQTASMEAAAERRENLRRPPRADMLEAKRQEAEKARLTALEDREFEKQQVVSRWKSRVAKAEEYQRQLYKDQKKDFMKRRAREDEVSITRTKLIEERLAMMTQAQAEAEVRSAAVKEMNERDHDAWVKEQWQKEEEKRHHIHQLEWNAAQRDEELRAKWEQQMEDYANRMEDKREGAAAMKLLRADLDVREAKLQECMRQAMVDSIDVDKDTLYRIISQPASSFIPS